MSVISPVLTSWPDSDLQRVANNAIHGDEEDRMSTATIKPRRSPAASPDFEGTINIGGVAGTEESLSGKRKRPMYSMQAVRSRRQAAATLGHTQIDEADAVATQDANYANEPTVVIREELLQEANGMLAAGLVNSGEFGSRAIRKGCGGEDAEYPARVGIEVNSTGEASTEGDGRLNGSNKFRGTAFLLGLAR